MIPTTRARREPDDAPDRLFDASPENLARVFGRRTVEMMRTGQDPYESARLSFSFAFMANPRLRIWELQ